MAVAALLPLRPLVLRTDTGIADEDIEPLVIGNDALGEPSRFGQRGKISLVEHGRAAACLHDVIRQRLCPRRVAAMDQ